MPLETTSLDRRWLAKMILFFAVLVFFGFYGLYDATIAYPNRGIRHASFLEFQYLDSARERGLLDRRLNVEDPVADLRRLRESDQGRLTETERARMEWLRSLAIVSRLKPEFTTIEDPPARFAALQQEWTTAQGGLKSSPKALAAYDIPVQWLFVVVGFGGGLWMAGLFVAVKRVSYRWDAETQSLHLPVAGSTHTLTPGDIEEFDKRKWHKFLLYLKIRGDHPSLGGREIKLDLYRHAKLEGWVLDMEKTAFPEHFTTPESQEGSDATPESESEASKVPVGSTPEA